MALTTGSDLLLVPMSHRNDFLVKVDLLVVNKTALMHISRGSFKLQFSKMEENNFQKKYVNL